jgi:Flp pilus assembly pilin Flp
MKQILYRLWQEEDGQDLIEYSLLITFIAVATAAVVGQGQNAIRSIWGTSNSTIVAANTSAAS